MQVSLEEFNHITGNMEHLYHEAALKLGMTDSELDMFYVIAVHGNGCNQSLLYKKTGMRKSTVNTSIRKLEKEDVLYLKPGEGRNTRVFLTEKGMGYLERAKKIIDIENKIYQSWSEEEQRVFMECNRKFVQQLAEEILKL